MSSITSGGVVWYNIQLSDGVRGWVSSQTTLLENSPAGISTIRYNHASYRGSAELKANGSKIRLTNSLALEDYLKGVVPNEMPASWHIEALKAQAIVARSYAANTMSLSSTTASQVYKGYSSETASTTKAVTDTDGIMVKYNNKPIQTFFYSTSGGRTANVGDVWNSSQASFPYLISVADPYESSPHSSWRETFSSSTILTSFGYNPSNTVLYDVKANPKGANGEIGSVTVTTSNGTKTLSGNENDIRKLFPVPAAYNMLRSNWFTLSASKGYTIQRASSSDGAYSVNGAQVMLANGSTVAVNSGTATIQTASGTITREADPKSIEINGKGWGHRIGMSQYGAKGFAENGTKAEDIVRHYYPGTTVSK
ncbi:SpoIID/LytB domain-containing protein [Bacillus lacus]|uniref:SpoIID/LytB domain-containing protein n=1 Tax=Metabacillus lacus TaxID=1983721 RepID=A0A7X2LYA8_9BACI|nr:SpoIID/LytB domain-containing protein [Metabacillus lacus]